MHASFTCLQESFVCFNLALLCVAWFPPMANGSKLERENVNFYQTLAEEFTYAYQNHNKINGQLILWGDNLRNREHPQKVGF